MVLTGLLALLAYLAPTLLGLAFYLRTFPEPRAMEGLAFGWGVGWVGVNLLLLVGNQILFIPFAREWMLPAALGLAGAALLLMVPASGLASALSGLPNRVRGMADRLGLRGLLLVGPAILLALVLLKGIVYPETGPDSIFYHLYLPQWAFATGALPRTAGFGMLQWPNAYPNLLVTQQVWVYFVVGSADQVLSRPAVPLYALLTAGLLVHAGERWRRGSGGLALLLWTTFLIPSAVLPDFLAPDFLAFGRLAVEIWSDVPVTFYALLALHFTLQGLRTGARGHALAGGTFAAGAALTKYNGFLFAALLVVAILAILAARRLRDRARPGESAVGSFRAAAWFASPLALTVPLLLRNALLFGNPVYPILAGVLGGPGASAVPFLAEAALPDMGPVKVQQTAVLLANLLFLLFIPALHLRGEGARALQAVGGGFVLALLVLFPFQSAFFRLALPGFAAVALSAGAWLQEAVFQRQRLRELGLLALAGTGSVLTVGGLPILVALAALLVLGLLLRRVGPLSRLRWGPRTAAQATLLVVISLALVTPSVHGAAQAKYPTPTLGPLPTGLPSVPDDEVLLRAYGDRWLLWTWMNENLPPGARVLAVDTGRSYLEAEIVGPTDPRVVAHYQAANVKEAVAVLQEAGVEYVLKDDFFPTYFVTRPFWTASPVFQNLDDPVHFTLLHREGGLELYRITT